SQPIHPRSETFPSSAHFSAMNWSRRLRMQRSLFTPFAKVARHHDVIGTKYKAGTKNGDPRVAVFYREAPSGIEQHGDGGKRHRVFRFDLVGDVVLKKIAKARIGARRVEAGVSRQDRRRLDILLID